MSEMAAMLEQTSTAMAQQNDALTKSQKQVATLEEARERLQDELLVERDSLSSLKQQYESAVSGLESNSSVYK